MYFSLKKSIIRIAKLFIRGGLDYSHNAGPGFAKANGLPALIELRLMCLVALEFDQNSHTSSKINHMGG